MDHLVREWDNIDGMLQDSLKYNIEDCVIVNRQTHEVHEPKRSTFASVWDELSKSAEVCIRGHIVGLIDPSEDPYGIYPLLRVGG